jgi:RNA polymerase sigma-70 factor (ECF subfamily)
MNSAPAHPAFDAVARELASAILHFLERYVGNRAVAEELLQETLLRMNKGLPSFAGRSSVKTWAFAIASRVAADYLRHPDRKTSIVALDAIEEPIDPERGIEERLIVGEMNECMRGVIDSLPDAYRAALILHDLQGHSAEQTSEICECSVATAKIRIHRARNRLKEALAKQCEFYRDEESVFRCDRKVRG